MAEGRIVTPFRVAAALAVVLLWAGIFHVVSGWVERWRIHAILSDDYSEDPLKYERLGHPYFFRVTLRVTVDGIPFTIDQIGECRPSVGSGGLGGGYFLVYTLVPAYTGHHLPDGSAFYIRMPELCRFAGFKREGWAARTARTYIPITNWVNNLERPTTIEVFESTAYYDDPGARVRLEPGRIEFLAAEAAPVTPVQPSAFSILRYPPHFKDELDEHGKPIRFRRAWWLISADPPLTGADLPPEPRAISENGRFRVYVVSEELRTKSINWGAQGRYFTQLNARGASMDLAADTVDPEEIELARIGARMAGEIIPLRWKDGRYHASLRPRGYEIAQFEIGKDPLKGGEAWLVIDGEAVRVDMAGSRADNLHLAIWDTQSDTVYFLNAN